MAYALADVFIASYDQPPSYQVLDIDDTEDEVHGHQQLALFNADYDARCFLPLHIYEGQTGKLITAILRPGARPTGEPNRLSSQTPDCPPASGVASG